MPDLIAQDEAYHSSSLRNPYANATSRLILPDSSSNPNNRNHEVGGDIARELPPYSDNDTFLAWSTEIEEIDRSDRRPECKGYTQDLMQLARPTERSFMDWYPKGEASISFFADDSRIETISGINVWLIEERCPLLAAAFEHSNSGPQIFLETLASSTALPFIRYLYTGSYAVQSTVGDGFEDVPTSVLFHCLLFRLGDLFDLPALKTQAYVNVLRQCEFGCCSPAVPIDLCAAIRYMYKHLHEHENLIGTIISYCVSCFLRHRLGSNPEFRKLAYELRPFHQDMCKVIMSREFENDTACAIIQLPFEPHIPETIALNNGHAPGNGLVYHFHSGDDTEDESPRKRRRQDIATGMAAFASSKRHPELELTLGFRSEENNTITDDSASEHDFQVVRKRSSSSAAEQYLDDLGLAKFPPATLAGSAGSADLSDHGGFVFVSGPAPLESASSESETEYLDADTPVDVPRPSAISSARESAANSGMHIRARRNAARAGAADGSDSSDSEWTVL